MNVETAREEFAKGEALYDIEDLGGAHEAYSRLLTGLAGADSQELREFCYRVERELGCIEWQQGKKDVAMRRWNAIATKRDCKTPDGVAAVAAAVFDVAIETPKKWRSWRLLLRAEKMGRLSKHPFGVYVATKSRRWVAKDFFRLAETIDERMPAHLRIAPVEKGAAIIRDRLRSIGMKIDHAAIELVLSAKSPAGLSCASWIEQIRAGCLADSGRELDAVDLYETASRAGIDSGLRAGLKEAAEAQRYLGNLRKKRGDEPESIAAFKLAIEYGQASGRLDGFETAARAARELGLLHETRGETPEAIVAWNESVRIGVARGKPVDVAAWSSWDIGRACSKASIAFSLEHRKAQSLAEAESAYETAVQLGAASDTEWGYAAAVYAAKYLGGLKAGREDEVGAIDAWTRAASLVNKTKDKDALAQAAYASLRLGLAEAEKERHPQARDLYIRGAALGVASGTPSGLTQAARAYFWLAGSREATGQEKEKLEACVKAYDIGKTAATSESRELAATAAMHLGVAAHQRNDVNAAKHLWTDALGLARLSEEEDAVGLREKIEKLLAV